MGKKKDNKKSDKAPSPTSKAPSAASEAPSAASEAPSAIGKVPSPEEATEELFQRILEQWANISLIDAANLTINRDFLTFCVTGKVDAKNLKKRILQNSFRMYGGLEQHIEKIDAYLSALREQTSKL